MTWERARHRKVRKWKTSKGTMQKLELRAIEDELSRDGGNTLRRYLDDNLRKELGLPAKKRKNLTHAARKMQEKGFPRWNDSLQSFMVYHCGLHGFDPDPATIAGKCFERECEHLKLDKRKEITVTTLSEALTIKSQINSIYIEETKTGFRIFKK